MPTALRRLASHLDRCPIERAQNPEDLNATAWIWQSLEDLEATIIGLVQSNLRHLPDDGQDQGLMQESPPQPSRRWTTS